MVKIKAFRVAAKAPPTLGSQLVGGALAATKEKRIGN